MMLSGSILRESSYLPNKNVRLGFMVFCKIKTPTEEPTGEEIKHLN